MRIAKALVISLLFSLSGFSDSSSSSDDCTSSDDCCTSAPVPACAPACVDQYVVRYHTYKVLVQPTYRTVFVQRGPSCQGQQYSYDANVQQGAFVLQNGIMQLDGKKYDLRY